jgi:hypothetical protein
VVFLFREEENTPAKLHLSILVEDAPFDAFEVGYRILNVNAGPPGAQVFPVASGTFEAVTSGAGHVGVGEYFAYDVGGLEGWTPAPTQELGSYRIEWRWKNISSSAYQTYLEDFQIVAESVGSPGFQIISVADVRAAGVPDPPDGPSDTQIQMSILVWQSFIERACRQWFYPKDLELFVDGSDSDALHFGVPIISVSELEVNLDQNNRGNLLPAASYRVYTDNQYPDNRANPRIKLSDFYSSQRDIFTMDCDSTRKFRKGRQNQRVKGVFGCVQSDGSAPPLIKYALTKLVIEKLRRPIVPGPSSGSSGIVPPLVAGIVLEEWTDDHRLKYAQSGGVIRERAPGLTGITDDQEILTILRLYKAPIGLATPDNASI